MFQPTHLVILFAVFLCACAAPAAVLVKTSEISSSTKEATPGLEVEAEPAKGDLETDAATYWRYMYDYGPRYNSFSGRSHGWGFGKRYDGWEPYVVYY